MVLKTHGMNLKSINISYKKLFITYLRFITIIYKKNFIIK